MKNEFRLISDPESLQVYEMFQEIPKTEYGFMNTNNGRTKEQFDDWVKRSKKKEKGEGLNEGLVPTTVFLLLVDGYPVGYGKLRHRLTDSLREHGGHGGYGIRPSQRRKGYGTILLSLMMKEAEKMGINKMLVTIQNENIASIKVAMKNGGEISRINDECHYMWLDCSH